MTKETLDIVAVAAELDRMRVFDGYSADELARFLPPLGAELVSFAKGETIVREGENARRVGILLEGAVHVLHREPKRPDVILRMLSAGSLVGLTSLLAAKPRDSLALVAFVDCTMLALSVDRLAAWRKDPASDVFFAAVERQLYELVLAMAHKCVIMSQSRIEGRVLSYLRHRCAEEGSRTVVVPCNEADFANYLGVHPVALSRTLANMRDKGLITTRRNVLTLGE